MTVVMLLKMRRDCTRYKSRRCYKVQAVMPVKQAWSAPQPISPTPGKLALQCSDIPPGGISQATCTPGVAEETLKKAPVLVSHREKCLDCSAQPEQTPVKIAEQHQSIVAMSGGQNCAPVDPRLRSDVQEFGDVTGSMNNRDTSQGQSGSVLSVRRNLLENELSDGAVGAGKDRGADFSPCDTTSGSGENSPEVAQMGAPKVDCGFPGGVLIPTEEEGIGPISPTGSDRELYQEKDRNPHWSINTKRQPEKGSMRNEKSQAAWNGSEVDYNSNCMQEKVPMFLREQVGLHSRSYPVQRPEWGRKFPWQEQKYGPPQVKSPVRPGWDSSMKAPVFPRPREHQPGGVGPGQFPKRGPPHVHPLPRMPYPRFQHHSPARPPHPSPPRRPPPHYPPQQTSPHRHPLSPYRPPPSSPRRGCNQTPPRPPMSNVSPRPPHGPPPHTGGFVLAGQYNKDTEVNNNNYDNYGSDFRQDYSEQCPAPPSYPTQGRGMVRGCPRGGGRGQPFPHPARGRTGLSGYNNRGGCPQRGRGGFRGRGFMAGGVQGRGRAQPAW